jgi:hypothetical protein
MYIELNNNNKLKKVNGKPNMFTWNDKNFHLFW